MSSIRLYNTLTRKKELFEPLEPNKVKMYVCGPTVYNYIHIGNARAAIVFDTIRRYLEFRGYEVKYVSNFTDVDDKLIKAARELGEDVPTIAERFIQAYFEDITALGCKKADVHPRVTENIDTIIEFIQTLIDRGYAYEVDGDVYYRTRKFKEYGKLSHQSIDELKAGARIEVGEKKEDPLDFALWKAAKEGEICWDSPWGKGRPGWHIECSAMARKYLGDTIDIHAGGQDLTFPHHENEIAQSEALTGKPFAKYWLHNGYLNINNEKMSKSLGNFVLVHDIIQQIDPQVLRFFMLSVHYRHPINYSEELLESAKKGLERLKTSYFNLKHRLQSSTNLTDDDDQWLARIQEQHEAFIREMDDDFNTANGIAVLFELSKQANLYLLEKNTSERVIHAFLREFEQLLDVLGITLQEEELLDEEIEALIQKRNEARKNRNFALADQIRDELKAKNIILEDTPQGTRWKRG
ncbi:MULTISPECIES: cysteine--tRNA ligase [Bacillaceae]|jgi:cysteinyl-tRNA synthetase|uniref:Cysteine--tRNA ligase n=4 Tax=Anoxybacillaceae TaxID=3120669 RepID=SYC_GEOSW|nr:MULTISPECIES: cysteine--tRNA ligase [Bacillaceae]C5D3P6.1 RecName: Full=Cysteine--tRNA ligase; AltName: Full=Cysteinyl-tRNA synthetase; Short=CysRS [Geobacillus sp. WCH70]PDM39385.1 cysteine--tRNA ligase [Parageobacillus yumthangensis]TXK92372.1 cysteine--tRNA ligase [Parageobacillus sp. SY1]KYD33021.1 Cysteinyl-tRNA synthetase [Parageobacillus toebii]MBB3870012.1 cysteinyl-tRNA synthetase [Parageobacillus toebii NBRC 107807]OXB93521.1 cysteine--tRNA ligase [Parageobacillus galactosidasius